MTYRNPAGQRPQRAHRSEWGQSSELIFRAPTPYISVSNSFLWSLRLLDFRNSGLSAQDLLQFQ